MARKRTTGTDSAAAAAPAPAREKRTVNRAKHAPASVAAVQKSEEAKPVVQAPEICAAPAPYIPTQEQIAALAYTYWESRGYQGGSSEEDWLRAENELRARGPIQA